MLNQIKMRIIIIYLCINRMNYEINVNKSVKKKIRLLEVPTEQQIRKTAER